MTRCCPMYCPSAHHLHPLPWHTHNRVAPPANGPPPLRTVPTPARLPCSRCRHCYHMWYNALMHKAASSGEPSAFNDASTWLSRLFTDGITEMRSFVRTAGRRFIISRPSSDSPPGELEEP